MNAHNRRHFLKLGTALAGGTLLAGSAPALGGEKNKPSVFPRSVF